MSQYIDFAVFVLTITLSLLAGRDMCILFVRSLLHFFRIFFWVLLDFHDIRIPSVHHLWTESKSGEIIFELIWFYLLYLFCFRYLQAKTAAAGMLPPQSTPALYPQRTTRAISRPMRMATTHEEYIKPDPKPILDSAPAPLPAAATLRLRLENNKPGGGSMPLNLNENITAQDRALSEQVRYMCDKVYWRVLQNSFYLKSQAYSVNNTTQICDRYGWLFLFKIALQVWCYHARLVCDLVVNLSWYLVVRDCYGINKHEKYLVHPENCDACMCNKWLITPSLWVTSLVCLPILLVWALLTGVDSLYMVFAIYDSYSKQFLSNFFVLIK